MFLVFFLYKNQPYFKGVLPKGKKGNIRIRDTINAQPVGISLNGSDVELELVTNKLTGESMARSVLTATAARTTTSNVLCYISIAVNIHNFQPYNTFYKRNGSCS